MIVGTLLRMLMVLEPDRDWTTLARVYNRLKQAAVPSRDKLACTVSASELLDLGIGPMDTSDRGQSETYRATRYRDDLLIALLISCPMRLKNLAGLVIGQHLVFDGRDYRVKLTAAETKTGRPYVAAVPHELTPYVERWLRVYRPQLIAQAGGRSSGVDTRLWLDRSGKPMTSYAIGAQIMLRTRQAFGNGIWPHLFRDCAVTELVDCAPEEIGIAPDLLGHAGLRMTRKHYIQSQGMTAHRRVQELIAMRRRAASGRRRPGA
jgi:integrase/recombinase XerD